MSFPKVFDRKFQVGFSERPFAVSEYYFSLIPKGKAYHPFFFSYNSNKKMLELQNSTLPTSFLRTAKPLRFSTKVFLVEFLTLEISRYKKDREAV